MIDLPLLIAGGRTFILGRLHFAWLDILQARFGFTEVVSGCAPGADLGGEVWARRRGLKIKRFPAVWSMGRKAGPIRNQQMADYVASLAGKVALFPGGAGTASMDRIARSAGLEVFLYAPGPVRRTELGRAAELARAGGKSGLPRGTGGLSELPSCSAQRIRAA